MQPLKPIPKRSYISSQEPADPAAPESASAKRERREPEFSDHLNKHNWNEVKKIFEKADLKQKIIFLSEIGDNTTLSPSTIAGLNETLAPLNVSDFIRDYKAEPYSALFKHLGNCYDFISQLEVERFNQKVHQANATIKFQPTIKQFAHVFSDFILEKSSFQGLTLTESIKCLHQSLQVLNGIEPQWSENIHLQTALLQIGELEKEAVEMVRITALSSESVEKEIALWARKRINKLRHIGALYLPSGWLGNPFGHAMIAHIRQTGSTYCLSLYNTGDGIEYHQPKRIIDGKEKFIPLCKWENIPAEEVESEVFFKLLFGMIMTRPPFGSAQIFGHHIYFLLETFFGKPSIEKDHSNDAFITGQRSGTCSWKCLLAFLEFTMPKREYLRLKLKIKLIVFALSDTASLLKTHCKESISYQRSCSANSTFLPLYQPTIEKLSRSIYKLYNQKIITSNELFQAFLVFQSKPAHAEVEKPLLTLSGKDCDYALKSAANKSEEFIPIDPPLFAFDEVPDPIAISWDTKEKMLKGLHTCIKHIQHLYDSQRHEECILLYDRYLLKIPQISDSIWNQLNLDEINVCSQLILTYAQKNKELRKIKTSESVINTFFLYQLQHMLVKNGIQLATNGVDILQDEIFIIKEMAEVLDICLTTPNPEMVEKVKLLQPFLESKRRIFRWDEERAAHDENMIIIMLALDFGIVHMMQRYMQAIGKKEMLPPPNPRNYTAHIKNQTLLPPLFWNLWQQFWTTISTAPNDHSQWKVELEDGEDEDMLDCYLATDDCHGYIYTKDEMKDLPKISATGKLGFHFQNPDMVDLLIKKTGLLTKNEWLFLTAALFQGGQDCVDEDVPFLYEINLESAPILLRKLYALLKGQLDMILLNHQVEELDKLEKLLLTIHHYVNQTPHASNEFLSLLNFQQMALFYDSSPEDQKVNAGLVFLSFCQSRQTFSSKKWCDVYLKTLFKAASDFDRTNYMKCRAFGASKKELLQALNISEIKEILETYIGSAREITGSWPFYALGDKKIDLERGCYMDESGHLILQLSKQPDFLAKLSGLLSESDYPVSLTQKENRLEQNELGISLVYFKDKKPVIQVSAERLEKMVNKPLTGRCDSGYTYGAINGPNPTASFIVPQSLYKRNKYQTWRANNGNHTFFFDRQTNDVIRLAKEDSRFVLRNESTGFYYVANYEEIPSDAFGTEIYEWTRDLTEFWHNPQSNEIILNTAYKNLHFLWNGKTKEIFIKEFPGFVVCPKYHRIEDAILLKNETEDYILLFQKAEKSKNNYIVLKNDKEIKQFDQSFVGAPHDIMAFVELLMRFKLFELASFYYKKTPKLPNDQGTWKILHRILNPSAFRLQNGEPNFYALISLITFDFFENHSSYKNLLFGNENDSLNRFKRLEYPRNIYNEYVKNYSNVTRKLRLARDQEEFLVSLFPEDSILKSHLQRIKGLSQEFIESNKGSPLLVDDKLTDKELFSLVQSFDFDEKVPNKTFYSLYHLNFQQSKVFLTLAKEIIEGIATKNIALKQLALAKFAYNCLIGIKREYSFGNSSKRGNELKISYQKECKVLYSFLMTLARAANNSTLFEKLHQVSHDASLFKQQLCQLYALLKKDNSPAILSKGSAVINNDTSMADVPVPSDSEMASTRHVPFASFLEHFFIKNEEVGFSIEDLAATVEQQTDKIGVLLLGTIKEHSKTPLASHFTLKEGMEALLRHNLTELERKYRELAVKEVESYKNQTEPSFTHDFNEALIKLVRTTGGVEKETTLSFILERYLTNSHPQDSIAVRTSVERIITSELYSLVCRQAIKALDRNDFLLAGQILQSTIPLLNGENDSRTRVQVFYQLIAEKIFREKQWDVFDKVDLNEKTALQIDCGMGKTKVITVVLAMIEMLIKKRLVLNIVPQGNAETNVSDLVEFMGSKTDHRISYLSINRKFGAGLEELTSFYQKLKRNLEAGVICVAIPQTFQSLLLKYFEVLLEAVPVSEAELHNQRLICFEKILNLIIFKSSAIIDEGHEILSANKTLNFSLEDEDQGIDPARFNDLLFIFSAMEQSANYGYVFPVGLNHNREWTRENYHAVQKQFLVSYIVGEFFPETEWQDAAALLLANRHEISQENKAYFYSKDSNTKERLLLLRAHLHYYLPYTLNLRCSVNYGPLIGVKEAVPYQYNECPSTNSKFQNPDIVIALSIQQTLQLGLSAEQIIELLRIWQRSKLIPKEIQEACSINLLAVNIENAPMVAIVHNSLHHHRVAKLEYARLCILPEIKLQTQRLSSNAQDLGGILFPIITTFSGTLLSNFMTLPARMKYDLDGKVDAQMLRTLLLSDHFSIASDCELQTLLADTNTTMVLDPNAHFEGMSNQSVAAYILGIAPPDVEAVAYFDDATNLLTQLRRGTAPGRVITYCDQKHTTGTDTVQPLNGVAVLIVNKGMTWTDLVQAAKRMRQLGKGQKVVLSITPILKKIILEKVPDNEFKKETVLLWALLNESSLLGSSLTLSLQQQVHTAFRRPLIKKLIGISGEPEFEKHRKQLVEAYRPLIVEQVDNYEYREHGSIEPPLKPYEQLEKMTHQYCTDFPHLLEESDRAELDTILAFARSILSDSEAETINDRLNMHMQTEKREVRLLSEELEDDKGNDIPHIKEVERLLTNGDLITKQAIYNHIAMPNLVYLSVGIQQKIRLDERLMFTSRLLFKTRSEKPAVPWMNILEQHQFELYLPKIQYILAISVLGKSRFYTIIPTEAETIREFAQTTPYKAHYLAELRIFNAEGEQWLHYRNPQKIPAPEPLVDHIIAQVKFINADIHYTARQAHYLKGWLRSGNIAEKIAFFWQRQKILSRKDPDLRFCDPSVINGIFSECLK